MTLSVSNIFYDFALTPDSHIFPSADRNETTSKVFTLENAGNVPLHGITIVNYDIESKYNWTVNQSSLGTMNPGETRQLSMSILIPLNEDSGNHSIGNIQIKSDEYNETFRLSTAVRNKLEIADLEVTIDGDTDSNINDGDEIGEKAKPESEIEFEIKIANNYDDRDNDIEIQDVVVTVTIMDIDDGDDLEEESESFDLDADEYKRVDIKFDLPLRINEGTYDVEIDVEGEDEEGIEHTVHWELKLEVDKKSHEVSIRRAVVSPSTLKCSRSATLNVEVINLGTHDEDETVLTITNSDLDIDISEEFELNEDPDDDDNTYSKRVEIRLGSDFQAGNYPISIKLYYNTNILDDSRVVDLFVEDCPTTTPPPDNNGTTVIITPPTTPVQPTTPTPGTATAVTTSGTTALPFTQTGAYVALLVLAVIIAVGAVLFVLIALLRR